MENIFVSKNYIYDQYNKGKNLILFGASEISRKTRRTFKQIKFSYIIDNSQHYLYLLKGMTLHFHNWH